jgi:hypothetical protein
VDGYAGIKGKAGIGQPIGLSLGRLSALMEAVTS